jgi:hypothetical protein
MANGLRQRLQPNCGASLDTEAMTIAVAACIAREYQEVDPINR